MTSKSLSIKCICNLFPITILKKVVLLSLADEIFAQMNKLANKAYVPYTTYFKILQVKTLFLKSSVNDKISI